MESKKCKECGEVKSLSAYYINVRCKDGHHSKCKSCSKKISKERQSILRKNPIWLEKEKERSREKYHRLGYKNRRKSNLESK
jgi:hypothetical protein